MNQNALHLSDNTNTEYTNYISVFEFLIQSGVDVTCKDKVKYSYFVVRQFINL